MFHATSPARLVREGIARFRPWRVAPTLHTGPAPMLHPWLVALLGGALIGGAAALLLLTHGRVAGISGVVGALLPPDRARDRGWNQ